MKKKNFFNIIILLIFFLSLNIIPSPLLKFQYKSEIPKLSAGEINIITPENKTYTNPISGYYPASYGFECDKNGQVPTGWIQVSIGGTCKVIPSLDDHNKVVELHDSVIADSNSVIGMLNNFGSTQIEGRVDFYFRSDDLDKETKIFLYENTTSDGVYLDVKRNRTWWYKDMTYHGIIPVESNRWYHFSIEFNSTSDRYWFYIDGAKYGGGKGFEYQSGNAGINHFRISSYKYEKDYSSFIDAIGYSWDPHYNIGDNLNEGLLLRYENITILDWQGYSLDGQANKTILGNTTFPMVSDGIHSIQVFGNDSMGTMYESDVRYFTVATTIPEITIISPIESEFFGKTAPAYNLSINNPYETVWYTIDGGLTNITASGLTGTINQTEWEKFENGIVTITFYASNFAGFIGSAEVQVVKDISKGNGGVEIPSYNLFVLIGACCVITLFILKKRIH